MKRALVAGLLATAMSTVQAQDEDFRPPVEAAKEGRHIMVNIPQKRLFVFEEGVLTESWTAGVGKSSTQTPVGEWVLSEKRKNPTWYVPPSLRKKTGAAVVPPGPKNPLGPVFMRAGATNIGIHGTNAPKSVPGWVSSGCVRLHNENAKALSEKAALGDRVSLIYERVVFSENGTKARLLPDPYGKGKPSPLEIMAKSIRYGIEMTMEDAERISKAKEGETFSLSQNSAQEKEKSEVVSSENESSEAILSRTEDERGGPDSV